MSAAAGPATAVAERWTAQPAELDEAAFFALLDERPFALLHGRGRFLVLAQAPLRTYESLDLPPFRWERSGEAPPIQPDLVGFVAYGAGEALTARGGPGRPPPFPFPDVRLTVYREVRVYDRAARRLHVGRRTGAGDGDDRPHLLNPGPFRARRVWGTETPESHAIKVVRIREAIARGEVYQVNLTRLEGHTFEGDLRELARRLHALDPAPFSALLAGPEGTVLSASPERFLRLRDGALEAWPVKGTAPRGEGREADLALARRLRESEKDRAELTMIVDLLRNDLGRLARLGTVAVDPFPVLETHAHVHHLVATVRARLAGPVSLRELLAATLPGGSVTGCPKLAALALLRELEPHGRGPYCGALGWMSHDLAQLDLGLPIRTAFAGRGELAFGVGGAVTWDSDPAGEWAETVHKARSFTRCLR
jgi:para-aminobenzoate synthetase component 1